MKIQPDKVLFTTTSQHAAKARARWYRRLGTEVKVLQESRLCTVPGYGIRVFFTYYVVEG